MMGGNQYSDKILLMGVLVLVSLALPLAAVGAADGGFAAVEESAADNQILAEDNEIVVGDSSNADYETIQGGINAASDGDTVVVEIGTYNEAVIVNKSVTLVAEDGVVVDGEGMGDSAFTVRNDSSTLSNVVIKGFEITNYTAAENTEFEGHGIVISDPETDQQYSDLVIKDNRIHNVDKSGIYLVNHDDTYGNATLANNNISNFDRAGLIIASKGTGTTDGVTAVNNTIEASTDGIAIEVITIDTSTLENVTIAGTEASGHWIGLDVTTFDNSTLRDLNVTHNDFSGNDIGFRGLVLGHSNTSELHLEYNTFENASTVGLRIWSKNSSKLDDLTVTETALNDSAGYGFELRGYNETQVTDVDLSRVDLSNNDGGAAFVQFNQTSSLNGLSASEVTVENSATGISLVAGGDSVHDATVRNVSVTESALNGTDGSGLRIEANGQATASNISLDSANVSDNQRGVEIVADGGIVDRVDLTTALVSANDVGVDVQTAKKGTVGAVTIDSVVLQNSTTAGLNVSGMDNGKLKSVSVRKSLLRDNAGDAVAVGADVAADNVSVHRSLFLRNDRGVHNENTDENVDARFNYWGHSTGPSSETSDPLQDPVTEKLADGDGDSVSSAGSGVSNVRFSPGICGKTETRDQMIRPIPDGTVNETIEQDVGDRTISENITVNVADCVGISIWERSVLPFRTVTDDAGTAVTIPEVFVKVNGETGSINRREVAAFNQNEEVTTEFKMTDGADTTRFENETAQVLIVRADPNANLSSDLQELLELDQTSDIDELREVISSNPDIHAEADRESGEVIAQVDGLEIVEVREEELDGIGETSVTFTPDQSGQYAAVLATVDTGDGFQKADDGLSFNLINDTSTVVGVEQIAVQKTTSTVTPESDTVQQGSLVDFDVDANLGTGGDVAHVLVTYDKDAFEGQTIIIDEVDAENLSDTTSFFRFSGTADGDAFFIEAVVNDNGTIESFEQGGSLTDVDSSMVFVVDSEETETLTLPVGENAGLSEGEEAQYQYVHVAVDQTDLDTWSSDEGQITVTGDPVTPINVKSASLNRTEIEPGDAVELSVHLENPGSERSVQIEITIGETVTTRTVLLGNGKTTETFTLTFDEEGEFDVGVEGVHAGTVTVSAADDSDDSSSPGGGGGGGQPSDPSATVRVTDMGDFTTVSVRDSRISETIDVDLGDSITGGGVSIDGIQLQMTFGNDVFRVEFTRPTDGELDGVPSLPSAESIAQLHIDAVGVGDDLGGATISFTVDDERMSEIDDPDDVRMFRFNDGEWQQLETRHLGGNRFEAETPGFSPFAIGVVVQSDVSVTDAAVSDTEIEAGETVDVTATLRNDGSSDEPFTAELMIDGKVVDSTDVDVPAGETREVEFQHTFEETGTFDVAVSGEDAGTVEVREDVTDPTATPTDTPAEPPAGSDDARTGLLIVLGVIVLALAGTGVYYYREDRFPWEQ